MNRRKAKKAIKRKYRIRKWPGNVEPRALDRWVSEDIISRTIEGLKYWLVNGYWPGKEVDANVVDDPDDHRVGILDGSVEPVPADGVLEAPGHGQRQGTPDEGRGR